MNENPYQSPKDHDDTPTAQADFDSPTSRHFVIWPVGLLILIYAVSTIHALPHATRLLRVGSVIATTSYLVSFCFFTFRRLRRRPRSLQLTEAIALTLAAAFVHVFRAEYVPMNPNGPFLTAIGMEFLAVVQAVVAIVSFVVSRVSS